MIAYLSGKIIFTKTGMVILLTNGVGYKILIPQNINQPENVEANFFIHQHFKEDAQDLYGFRTYTDLELFEKLISVNGVGPKAGITILSNFEAQKIIDGIINEDLTLFQSIPGVGKKVAAKIILELKSKISGLSGNGVIGKIDEPDDMIDALTSLGYKKQEIIQSMIKVPANLKTSEEKIKWFLKHRNG